MSKYNPFGSLQSLLSFGFCCQLLLFGSLANAQEAKLTQAFKIKPKQTDVDYDDPAPTEIGDCKFEVSTDPPGFVVTDGTNRILRQFFDTNRDGKLDRWSYFKNGIEVYRDIDSDFDRRTDAYRWLGAGGTRWGLDADQDGTIDSWKIISAEEIAFEVFQAIAHKDPARFERLLLSADEFKSLELGETIGKDVKQRLLDAKSNFPKVLKSQKKITSATTWVHASNGLPAMTSAGAEGIGKDVIVYDHASAVFKSGEEYGQLALGSVVQVQSGLWKLIELPELVEAGTPITNGGAFFPMPMLGGTSLAGGSLEDSEMAKRYGELADLEKDLAATKKDVEIATLESQKAKLLEEIYTLTKDVERKHDWLENIADSVASAYQNKRYPDGLKFLEGFVSRLEKSGQTDALDYIRWRAIYARYGLVTEDGNSRQREEANNQLIDDLKAFQKKFKSSPHSADALTQLGIHYEVHGEPEKSIEWYQQAVDRFPNTQFGKRATGALQRIESKGQKISFEGEDLRGTKFNLSDPKLRGKIVIIHFWETWCPDGLEEIQRLAEKYKGEVVFVGCNIDSDTKDFQAYLAEHPDYATAPVPTIRLNHRR